MKTTLYYELLEHIIQRYLEQLERMYWWNLQADRHEKQRDTESRDIAIKIRNDAAKQAAAFEELIEFEEFDIETIRSMHEEAQETAEAGTTIKAHAGRKYLDIPF